MPDIEELGNDAISIGLEKIREFIRHNKRTKVVPIEEKRKQQRALIKPVIEIPRTIDNIRLRKEDQVSDKSYSPNFPKSPPPNKHDLYLIDLDVSDEDRLLGLDKIQIQNVPKELNYDPRGNFVTIATMGRNNPFYHYTGSEDTLEFELDWYSVTENRQDVINKCRYLEALSKNNGYTDPPHRVKLAWGDILFRDAKWLITRASYVLTLPSKPNSYLHIQANQFITLKRVTEDNLNRNQIRSINN